MPVASTDLWEKAYLQFETPAEEVRKFRHRLVRMGALGWARDGVIVELFCGRGSGLQALEEMGFTCIEGVDISPTLVSKYRGLARCFVADCRHLEFAPESKDIVIVQGGLHHLENLPVDLEYTLAEAHRVLKPHGRILVVEPWRTPFLSCVHAAASTRILRFISKKLNAFATMVEHEKDTYEKWLNCSDHILKVLNRFFLSEQLEISMGKLFFLGRKRDDELGPS